MSSITENCHRVRERIPGHVTIVAAGKTRTVPEILQAIEAGITVIGHNYVQEAEPMIAELGDRARWHLIGHLQKNKAKKAAPIFDLIETVDSLALAELLDRRCAMLERTMPVLIEVNSGREPNKTGVFPEDVDDLVRAIAPLEHLRLEGLMTMGPRFGNPEDARPYFRATKEAFDRLAAADIPGAEMRILSMGMSNSYEIAIEEGSTMVRIGTKLFGERED
ncbi:MAG: YggS family pyridoxal phosphate-dependent enzyme [Planctomycetota bacterium]|nr:YggS family pyridoxal phosphate-dependent enzyme [Planctomycetota bacterium]